MIDPIPHVLTSKEQLLLRLGCAAYGDCPPGTRETALALGHLSLVADVAGFTATVAVPVEAVNLRTNVNRVTPLTLGETLAAMSWLRDMEVMNETARMLGSLRLCWIDTRALCIRVDPVLDFCGPQPDYGAGHEGPTYGYGQEAA